MGVMWRILLLHLVATVVCSLAHHVLALLYAAPQLPFTALLPVGRSSRDSFQSHDFGAVDRLCATVCESMYALIGAVAFGPTASWLRAHGGLLVSPEGYHIDAASAAAPGLYFEGWYYKAVLGDHRQRSVVFIPGVLHKSVGGDGFGFVIVVDSVANPSHRARLFRYALNATGPAVPREGEGEWAFTVGPNRFSAAGAAVRLDGHSALSCEVSGDLDSATAASLLTGGGLPVHACGKIVGELKHDQLQPLPPSLVAPDAMGWLAYLPNSALPCRHGVVSLGHHVVGRLAVGNEPPVEVEGHGYVEKDWGAVFPARWLWLQCNTFHAPASTLTRSTASEQSHSCGRRQKSASLLLSIAELPVPSPHLQLGSFNGILALLWIPVSSNAQACAGTTDVPQEDEGKLWRFATYNGERLCAIFPWWILPR